MTRRGLIVTALVLWTAAMAVTQLLPGARSEAGARLMLVYVGAKDCASCAAWERGERLALFAAITKGDVEAVDYREVVADSGPAALSEEAWPAQLRPLRASAPAAASDLPYWLLVEDDALVVAGGGVAAWTTKIRPALQGGTTPRRE